MFRIALSAVIVVLTAYLPMASADGLAAGETLAVGESKKSDDDRFVFTMEKDGSLTWKCGEKLLWSTPTVGTKDAKCVMQSDGNLVVYGTRDSEYKAIWNSNTPSNPGAKLECQSDGNLVIYKDGKAIWATYTHDPAKSAIVVLETKRWNMANLGYDCIHVYVNDLEVGMIDLHTTKSFSLTPRLATSTRCICTSRRNPSNQRATKWNSPSEKAGAWSPRLKCRNRGFSTRRPS